MWNSDFIEGKVITPRGTRIRPTIGETAKRSEIVQTFENGEEWLTQFDSVEQAREYWNKESTRINALRAEYGELNEQAIKRQSEIDSLIAEKSLLFVENIKENEHRTQDEINAVRLPISEKTYREFTIGEFSDIPEHLQQFYIQKDKRPNAVVFVRMGDFYEAFGPDAQIIADKLDLTVTSRTVQGFEQRVPMIGIPYHAFESYAGKLNEFGIDVVSCAKTDEHYQAVLFEAQREQALNVESKLNTENKEQQVVDNNEQVLPSETRTQEISQTSWTKISIDENQVGTKFDKNTMIKLPNTEQLKGYVVFVPTKIVRKDKQGYFVSLKGDMSFTIKNDGMEMKVTASELVSLLQGKDVGKEPLRVGPKKINKDRIEALDSSLPSELKELNQWCAFTTFKDEQGNYKKKNIDVKTGNAKGWAKVNDPTTWTDFKTAKQYALENNCAGLTIVLTPESGVTCIDLDKCIDDAGNVSEFAQKVLKATEGTYAEKSVSGHGIHIFVKGDLLDNGKYKNVSGSKENGNEIEVYNQSKFISLTGNVIGDSAQNLNNIKPAQLSALHELMEKRPTVSTSKTFTTVRTATADVVEQRILRSKKKSEYQRLMAGDSLSGGDHSKDDFKLLNLLAFFSDCDASVMREIFMRSKLYREEGGVGNKKSTGYLDTSIKNAINSLANRPRGFADTEHQPGLFDKRKKKSITADNGNGGGAGGNEAGAE